MTAVDTAGENLSVDNDSQLVLRAQGGDQDAFAELVHRHRDHVFRLALSILGPGFATEAEDIAQEVFLKVHFALASFRGDSQISSWIYRIAFNTALNLKARARYQRPHLDETELALSASQEPGPNSLAETAQRNQALADCMQTLPEVYQSALRLYYWLDTGIAELAALLDVPENTAKSYLHRARQLLDVMLKERGYSNV
jgi:RNA polymerase sigma-70 factor, ECF subfamily